MHSFRPVAVVAMASLCVLVMTGINWKITDINDLPPKSQENEH
jgi:hypothetical protein